MHKAPRSSLVNRLIETDDEGRIRYVTPEAATVLGVAPRDLVGRDLFRLFPQQQRLLRLHLRAVLVANVIREAVDVTITRPREGSIDARLTAVKLDARRVQWRIARNDEM